MSLGGYKFAGRYCQKGSLTDQQWALLMHKTKVAAFMAANALSGAGWDYDMSGSPDGNYHCLDSVGNNYVTCFKNTAKGAYFAIYTLTCFGPTADAGTGRIAWTPWVKYTRMGPYASFFARIGSSHIDYFDGPSATISGVTGICSMGNPGTLSSGSSYSGSYGKEDTYFSASENYYGFAVKDSDVIVISGYSLATTLCCSILSASAFSSLFNASDTESALLVNLQPCNTTSIKEYAVRLSNASMGCSFSLVSRSDGSVTNCNVFLIPIALYSGAVQEYPFQSLTICDDVADECYGKGVVKVELFSANMQSGSSSLVPDLMKPFANGNFLCASIASSFDYKPLNKRTNGIETVTAYTALYVGWDPSNPDITQASAWTEYTDA